MWLGWPNHIHEKARWQLCDVSSQYNLYIDILDGEYVNFNLFQVYVGNI